LHKAADFYYGKKRIVFDKQAILFLKACFRKNNTPQVAPTEKGTAN